MSEYRKQSRISVMQMFHELKQQFPTVPDQVVSDCVLKHSTNREACTSNLKSIQKNYVQQTYPSDIVDKMANRPKTLEISQNNVSLPKSNFSNKSPTNNSKNLLNSSKSDSDNTHILDIDFNINRCQCSNSAPSTPQVLHQGEHRHKSCVSLDSVPFSDAQCRPFTSVSLTLRTPTKDPLPPLDLSAGGGSELTYTACSFDPTTDPKNCYQSRLHINIDPEGETTVTASRVMVSPTNIKSINRITESQILSGSTQIDNILPTTKLVINAQLEQKKKLVLELSAEKQRLEIIKKNIVMMKEDIDRRRTYSRKIQHLRNDIALLQLDCNKLNVQVDIATGNRVPLNDESNDQLYNKFYTGQKVSFGKMHKEYQEHSESQNWACRMCTFQNHPILPRCEECNMARFDLGTTTSVMNNIPLNAKLTSNLTRQCLT